MVLILGIAGEKWGTCSKSRVIICYKDLQNVKPFVVFFPLCMLIVANCD